MPDDSQVKTQVTGKTSGRNEPSIEPYRMSASFHAAFGLVYKQMSKCFQVASSQNRENENSWTAFGELTVDQHIGSATIRITIAAMPWHQEKPEYGIRNIGDGNS